MNTNKQQIKLAENVNKGTTGLLAIRVNLFDNCKSITSCPIFDTSKVINLNDLHKTNGVIS